MKSWAAGNSGYKQRMPAPPRKTRRRRGDAKLPQYATTMYGLNEWYNAKLERLGLMVLLKARGETDLVAMYKHNMGRLHRAILQLMKEYKDHDRLHDLKVMRMNVECIMTFIDKHL
jgi:hypothetical protein